MAFIGHLSSKSDHIIVITYTHKFVFDTVSFITQFDYNNFIFDTVLIYFCLHMREVQLSKNRIIYMYNNKN